MSTPWPASIGIVNSKFLLNENKASVSSLFSRYRQITSLSAGTGDRWEGALQTRRLLTATDNLAMWAFMHQVGLLGDFTLGDPDYSGTPISGQSSILVNGAGQSGMSLVCDGATPSVICLRAGEYFQQATQLHVMTADATANGSGQLTLNFKPALRASPADNAVVTLSNPVALLKMTNLAQRETDDMKSASYQVTFEESL